MTRSNRTRLVAALLSMGAGACWAYSPDASASFVRQSAFSCFAPALNNTGNSQSPEDNSYGLYNDSYNDLYIDCPTPDDDRVQKASWSIANIEAYIPAGESLKVEACFSNWNGQSGGCSSQVIIYSQYGGHVTATLEPPAIGSGTGSMWDTNSDTDFGYAWIDIPTAGRLAGVFYST